MANQVYYPIMERPVAEDRFPISLYATPVAELQDVLYTIPRAGHLVAGAGHHVRRDHFPGHEWILCLRGRGFVRVHGRTHEAVAGDFVWINCHHPHEHGAVAEDPWEVYWVRVEGPRLEQVCRILSVDATPVFSEFDVEAAIPIYRELFDLVAGEPEAAAPAIHVAAARLLALAFAARRKQSPQPEVPAALAKAVEKMRLFYFEPHAAADLAATAGMSVSHFSRVFRATFGTSPIDWLRRERIRQAKRRLGDTEDPIQAVAAQVGYRDRFFFSKDFKKLTGMTPREFRRQARGLLPFE